LFMGLRATRGLLMTASPGNYARHRRRRQATSTPASAPRADVNIGVVDVAEIAPISPRCARRCSNLLSNACKFTEKGTVTLSVRVDSPVEPESAAWLVFDVADTGIGMTEEEAEARTSD